MRSAPSVRGPRDLPDWRLWLVEQWIPGHPYERNYASGHVSLVADKSHGTPSDIGRIMARWEHRTTSTSALWWVSDEMVDLLHAAAPSVPDEYVLHWDDAPDMAGCVVFAHPLYGIDANLDSQVRVDAMVWGPVALPAAPNVGRPFPAQGIGISMYQRIGLGDLDGKALRLLIARGALDHYEMNDLVDLQIDGDVARSMGVEFEDDPDETPTRMVIGGESVEGHATNIIFPIEGASEVLFESTSHASITGHETEDVWVPLGRSDWVLGETITTPIVGGLDDNVLESMIEDRRWLAALWLLAGQVNISDRTTERPDRPAARRSLRAKMDPKVTVVKLRRLREASGDAQSSPGGREWQHRWIVSGHWRNQPCGPGRSLRRPVWIAPHVKGPEGMPLVARPKVKALVR